MPSVPRAIRAERRIERDTAQEHVVLGTETFPYRDKRRYPLVLLGTVLGGGMSSTLFQRVREELGLAYAIYSYQSFYRETGVAGVYTAISSGSCFARLERSVHRISDCCALRKQ